MTIKGPKCDLIYGATKTRKTSMIAELAEYIWERFGKKTRVVHCDLGGYAPLEPYIEAGMIEVWPINEEQDIILTLQRAAEGYWPSVKDGKRVLTKDGLDEVMGYAFEGVTSISDRVYDYFKGKGIRLSQDQMFSYTVGEGQDKITYGGGSPSHIFEAQNRTMGAIQLSARLPVEKVLWTALEARGKDEGGQPVYGPQAIGKALGGKLGPVFGNFLHMEQLVIDKGVDPATKQVRLETRPVMYLKPHAEPTTKIPFHAGTRAGIDYNAQLPEYLDPPSLKKLYVMIDEARDKSVERIKKMMAARASVPAPSTAEKVTA